MGRSEEGLLGISRVLRSAPGAGIGTLVRLYTGPLRRVAVVDLDIGEMDEDF